MRKIWLVVVLLILGGGGWWGVTHWLGAEATVLVDDTEVTTGPLRESVQTTGALRPIKTVPVGSEVSGTVAWLGADFNDEVKAGEVIARLKPELFESRVAQAKANHDSANATLKKAELVVEDLRKMLPLHTELAQAALDEAQAAFGFAEYNLNKVTELGRTSSAAPGESHARKAEFEGAKAARERARISLEQARHDETMRLTQAEQDVELARARVAEAKATLDLAQQDLARCTIAAPIDGFIWRRLVSVGEPVVSAFTAQHLFIITPDLSHMQLHANVSEADIARVRKGQSAVFTVDATGEREFTGMVSLVRNDPVSLQGVVTYQVMIDVENPDNILKPEMTANVSIEVVKRDNVLKVANSALRFRPQVNTNELKALNESVTWPAAPEAPQDAGSAAAPMWASKRLLWAWADGQWKPTPVWIGISDNRETEILWGVTKGQRFVTNFIEKGGIAGSMKDALKMANPNNRSL